jgi:hypothetical protein
MSMTASANTLCLPVMCACPSGAAAQTGGQRRISPAGSQIWCQQDACRGVHQGLVGEGAPLPAGHGGDQQGAVAGNVGQVVLALVDRHQDAGPAPAGRDRPGRADALKDGVQAGRDVRGGVGRGGCGVRRGGRGTAWLRPLARCLPARLAAGSSLGLRRQVGRPSIPAAVVLCMRLTAAAIAWVSGQAEVARSLSNL